MGCLACNRQVRGNDDDDNNNSKSSNSYCTYHQRALQSLHAHYDVWVRAYGADVSWEKFLGGLDDMHETGGWVKEVIKAELKK